MSVSIKIMTIPGAPLEGVNPLPVFHKKGGMSKDSNSNLPENMQQDLVGSMKRLLPYRMQDRYSRKRLPMKMKTIVMENEYLKAVFWPENGGRLYSLFDKVQNRELLMSNPVYQPGNLAIRNAWLSGGIEWNYGWLGHNVFTCDHLFAAILKDDEGEEFIRFYEFERAKNHLFQMDFYLPKGSPVLYSHVKIFNPNEIDNTTYWWTNIAVPEDGKTRVLSSADDVLVTFAGHMTYEKMPFLSPFGEKDLSYPLNADRSYDHFYQVPDGTKTSWEAGAFKDGLVFFDRATAPLLYHKMFCWGNHIAGKRWQDYLSDPDKGDYIELQSGIARSQMHDKLFPAKSTMEWTQCFGGGKLDREQLHQESLKAATAYLNDYIESTISEAKLLQINEKFAELANKEVQEKDLVHMGSGWGALETMRREACGEEPYPKSMCFPKITIGVEQYPWYALLTEGKLPEEDPAVIPVSWMVSPKWMRLLEESIEAKGADWHTMLHYGIMLYDRLDEEHTADEASRWPEYPKYRELARKALLRSVELKPSVWALYCLFYIERDAGNNELAESYLDRLFTMKEAFVDVAFAIEFMLYLLSAKKYEKAWSLYESLPEDMKQVDRILLCAAQAAIKLRKFDFVEKVFTYEFSVMREGESTLTDVWFEYSALKLAKERGLGDDVRGEVLADLVNEAWDICPPPRNIDFRLSYSKSNKYWMED